MGPDQSAAEELLFDDEEILNSARANSTAPHPPTPTPSASIVEEEDSKPAPRSHSQTCSFHCMTTVGAAVMMMLRTVIQRPPVHSYVLPKALAFALRTTCGSRGSGSISPPVSILSATRTSHQSYVFVDSRLSTNILTHSILGKFYMAITLSSGIYSLPSFAHLVNHSL